MKGKLHKPRDAHFLEMIKRPSGAHGPSKKAQRQAEKLKLKKVAYNDHRMD